jgi:hypothetical protein
MSLETWKKEFYPIEASEEMSAKEAIEHSLRKWKGLRSENLDKHGVDARAEVQYIFGEDSFLAIDGSSCALCVKFLELDENLPWCYHCPLAKTLGRSCGSDGMPYITWMETGNPEPMIKALRKTLKNESSN